MVEMTANEDHSTLLACVLNIPKEYRSADLRSSFSQFVESNGFHTFHYRHRPEHKLPKLSLVPTTTVHRSMKELDVIDELDSNSSILLSPDPKLIIGLSDKPSSEPQQTLVGAKEAEISQKEPTTCCCMTKIYKHRYDDFRRSYFGGNFCDRNGKYSTNKILFRILTWSEASDLSNLPELHPPPEMPNGNVGTPLFVFMSLIKNCKLPSSIIKKLGLEFPNCRSRRRYGNVPYKYSVSKKTPKEGEKLSQSVTKSDDAENNGCGCKQAQKMSPLSTSADPFEFGKGNDKNQRNFECTGPIAQSNGETDAEDWERHEALHDDVDAQGRTKERLYEEDIELKWEKGGSGLVFYTDAYYWHEMKGKDFDADTADDWDVDMSVYTESGGGDKDSRELLQMRIEDRWHNGLDEGITDAADFERYTKGFGSRQLVRSGWKKGSGVGVSKIGIAEPIEASGQSARNKAGLGYVGAKLNRHPLVRKRRAERDVIISTIYDSEKDKEDQVLQRAGPDVLRYVDTPVQFVSASEATRT